MPRTMFVTACFRPLESDAPRRKIAHLVGGALIDGTVKAGRGLRIQSIIVHVRHDADNLPVNPGIIHSMAHIAARQILFRERFVDDHHSLALIGIRFGEEASAQQRRSQDVGRIRG